MKKYITVLSLYCFALQFGVAQTPFPAKGEAFRDDLIPRVDILIPQDSLDILLAPGNEQSNYHWHATFIFNSGDDLDTLENIGFRLRGNTSRTAAKKSFKVSFNTYEAGRKWKGLEKLNLNGEHNDPTISRSKLCWDLAEEMGIVAPRANHVELYFNGEYRGLYVHVEHIDEEFAELRFGNKNGNLYKCLYPADLDYKGANPDLYKEVFWGRRAYQLKTNEDEDDYSDLAEFIDVLNNAASADFACELEQIFNVKDYLKALAFDILIGNWDGPIYNKNNFYLYKNTATGKFEYIPFDLDNTFGIDWFQEDWATRDIYDWEKNGEPRPLYDRLMEVEEYRALFSYYTSHFLEEIFTENELDPYLDNLKTLLTESAENDLFRTFDYGFSLADWQNNFATEISFNHVTYGLKEYLTERRNNALSQLDFDGIAPLISQVKTNNPNENQPLQILARVEDDATLSEVNFCYQIDNQGSTTCLPMFDDGEHDDVSANDGIFGVVLSGLAAGQEVTYFIEAKDDENNLSTEPRCGMNSLTINGANFNVAINEIMASNSSVIADEEGEYDDWIELYNFGNESIYLGDKYLTDDADEPNKWLLPDYDLQPGEFFLIWADDDEEQGDTHANFKLSAGGEFVGLFSEDDQVFSQIDGLTFGEQEEDAAFGRIPNGTGIFLEVTPTPEASNEPLSVSQIIDNELFVLNAFPNPFQDQLQISFATNSAQPFKIGIQNAIGQTVFEGVATVGTNNLLLGTTDWGGGLYFVQVLQNGQSILRDRIVLQR